MLGRIFWTLLYAYGRALEWAVVRAFGLFRIDLQPARPAQSITEKSALTPFVPPECADPADADPRVAAVYGLAKQAVAGAMKAAIVNAAVERLKREGYGVDLIAQVHIVWTPPGRTTLDAAITDKDREGFRGLGIQL